jgi:hypothetical protein
MVVSVGKMRTKGDKEGEIDSSGLESQLADFPRSAPTPARSD